MIPSRKRTLEEYIIGKDDFEICKQLITDDLPLKDALNLMRFKAKRLSWEETLCNASESFHNSFLPYLMRTAL
jgi:hypothetical protein